MDDFVPATSGIVVHPDNGSIFKVNVDGYLEAAALQCSSEAGAAGSRLPGGASQNPHPVGGGQPRSVGSFALDPSMLEENTTIELLWLSQKRGQLCVLHRRTGQACILSTSDNSFPLPSGSTSTQAPAVEQAGGSSALWGAAGWIGGFFGSSEPHYVESEWLAAAPAEVSIAEADGMDCRRHTSVARALAESVPLHPAPLRLELMVSLQQGSFPQSPPGSSLRGVFPVAAGAAAWDALCILSVLQNGVEKAGLLYGLSCSSPATPVPLGAVPSPASTITCVQLTDRSATCIVQTSDSVTSTVGLTTPLKANGTLCSSWSEQPALQGARHLLAATGAGGEPLLLASFHGSCQVVCFRHSAEPHTGGLQRAWDAALPAEVSKLELGAPLETPPGTSSHTADSDGDKAAAANTPTGTHTAATPARARNPLQRRGLHPRSVAKGPAASGTGAARHQHAWVQCGDQLVWLDLTCGLWLRCPGFSAQQHVLSLGQAHALVATYPLPDSAAQEDDSEDEPVPELQLLALPRPARVCRSGTAFAAAVSGDPAGHGAQCVSLGLPSPSGGAFFVPGAVILTPPDELVAEFNELQPAVLALNRQHWQQVGQLRALHTSAGSCFQGEQHDTWRLMVLEGSLGSLVSAYRWHTGGCTHLPWQRVLPAPGRRLLEARIVDDCNVHVLSSDDGNLKTHEPHAHVTVFQAILMYGAAEDAERGPPSSQPSGLELHASETWSTALPHGSTAHLSEIAVIQHTPPMATLHAAVVTSHGSRHMLLREQARDVPALRVVCDKPTEHTQRIAGIIAQHEVGNAAGHPCIAVCIARDSPVIVVHSGGEDGALLCRLAMQPAESSAAPSAHNSHAEQRLAVSALQLTAQGQHQVLQQTLQHSQLPAGGYLHTFDGEARPLRCSMTLSAGKSMDATHGLLVALACVDGFRGCLPSTVRALQQTVALAVVPVVAQQLELALVHAYLLQDAHPGCVKAMVDCLSGLHLEDALATVIVTARKGEVSELTQWNTVAGHPLLLWAASVQCLVAGIADIALHIERVKHSLQSQVRASASDTPSAVQHAAAAAELQSSATPIAARASLAAYAATQCLMLVQETYLMRAGNADQPQPVLDSLPWLSAPDVHDAGVLSKAAELAQAMLTQLGSPGTHTTSSSSDSPDSAFWVMQLVVACTTRTGVEVQRLLQLLEPVLPRAARAALEGTTTPEDVPAVLMARLPARVQRLVLFVTSLRGLQEQVRAFTARMLCSRDSVAAAAK